MEPIVLTSYDTTWLFDTQRMRFRLILKDANARHIPNATAWRPYYGLQFDPGSDSFVILVNPEGTRSLRSWGHTRDGDASGEHVAAEALDNLGATG
jgi:hypothetical protein